MGGKTFEDLGFKIGDKVRCIKSGGYCNYEQGKEYLLVDYGDETPVIEGTTYNGFSGDWELAKENKFKIGDRVRYIGSLYTFTNRDYYTEGTLGTVVDFQEYPLGRGKYNVNFSDQHDLGCEEDELELVEEGIEMKYKVGITYPWDWTKGERCPFPEGTKGDILVAPTSDSADLQDKYDIHVYELDKYICGHNYWDGTGWCSVVAFRVSEYPKPEPKTKKVELELTEEELETVRKVLGKVRI